MFSTKPSASASKSTAGTKKQRTGTSATSQDKNASEIKCSQQDSDHGLLIEDFPINSKNPFVTEFCGSDIVLIVEGQKLHTHKQILCLYSPYFRVFLGSLHFAEANAREMELKSNVCVEVKYDAMVKFLLHLYPVHSLQKITDDDTLMEMISLSEYFQCQHVRTKCVTYLEAQMSQLKQPNHFDRFSYCDSLKRPLLYLRLCVTYRVNQLIEGLIEFLSQKRFHTIEEHDDFNSLTLEMQRDLWKKRVLCLERKHPSS